MDLTDIPLFDVADRRLAWINGRSAVLAANIANVNTPGYQPRDVPAFDSELGAALGRTAPLRTNPLHLTGTAPATGTVTAPAERAPDGNAVSLDQQLTKVADTAAAQQITLGLYRQYLGMFRTAIGH